MGARTRATRTFHVAATSLTAGMVANVGVVGVEGTASAAGTVTKVGTVGTEGFQARARDWSPSVDLHSNTLQQYFTAVVTFRKS